MLSDNYIFKVHWLTLVWHILNGFKDSLADRLEKVTAETHISETTSIEDALSDSSPSSGLILSHVSLLGSHRTAKKITLEHGIENAEESFPIQTKKNPGAGKQASCHEFKSSVFQFITERV